jgi:hypothetical protein
MRTGLPLLLALCYFEPFGLFLDIFIVWPEFIGLLFVPGAPLLDDLPAPVAEFPKSPVLLFELALMQILRS